MFITEKFHIGLRDIGIGNKLKNKSLLGFFEDIGGMHSDIAGLGVEDIKRTKLSWIILGWKVKIIKRPNYGEYITVKTWSSGSNKFYSFRDFEVYNEDQELIAIGTSKWLLYDIEKNRVAQLTEELIKPYEQEKDKKVFEEEPKFKIEEPENYSSMTEYKIGRNIIDFNEHVHNTYYIDLAYEALPKDIYLSDELDNIEIVYKKETKYGENVKCFYTKQENQHIIVIKDEKEENIHAMIKLS